MGEFDYEALWRAANAAWFDAKNAEYGTTSAIACLREQIEKAFVARDWHDDVLGVSNEQYQRLSDEWTAATARAEAAEADVQRLTEQGVSEVRNLIGTIQWILEDPVTNAEKYRAKLADARASMPSVQ